MWEWNPGMEESSSQPSNSSKEAASLPPLHSSNAASGSDGGARYRLMSPAKLPISRSPCLTIPAGLSPTSFLDSPVLLSNMKVEPSPTTGSFAKPQMIHGSVGSTMLSSTANCSNSNTFDERKSGSFEFKPPVASNSASGLFLVGSLVSADHNHYQGKTIDPVQAQHTDLSLMPSPTVKIETTAPSNELSLCSPGHMVTSMDSAPAEVDVDELNQQRHLNNEVQASQSDQKGIGPSVVIERSSEDGYNWRKYGQKHVKGSEFPRSYYKCTHPNCEVKKLFERSHDGQIVEIIYKGTHDHPKPQPSRRYASGSTLPVLEERPDKVSSLIGRDDKPPNIYGQIAHSTDPNTTPELSPVANDDVVEGAVLDEVDEDDPFSKRRKMEIGGIDITPVVKPIREPRVVVQTLSEVDILDDGYRWRKYGQKVVRGNPNPRSYYKCTNAGCPVRKHVERASHDPKAVITTYEGKHNHDVPTARNNSHDTTAGQAALNAMPMIRSEESDTISLDLGVGIKSAAENRPNVQQQTLQHGELVRTQSHTNNSNFQAVQATPVSRYYGVLNNGMHLYGFRENLGENRSYETPPLNHSSNPCPQNMGRVLMGP